MKRWLLGMTALACAAGALAQSNTGGYPARPITMMVGFAPGGGTDTAARIVARKLADSVGQSVVVENKPGAGGNIAQGLVAKAAPDGYTILLSSVGPLAVSPHMFTKLPYDVKKDFAPITMAVTFSNVLVVHPSVGVKSLAEFVQRARDKPGTLTYGSSGIGGAGHLSGAMLAMMAGIDIVHVPYKGGGPAMQGMLGNQVSAIFATPVSAGPHIKAGKILALATTGPQRAASMPEVPTVAESGFPGYAATNWYAFVAPAKTPRPVLDRLNRELVAILGAADVRAQLEGQGMEPHPGTPEELATFIDSEYETWGRVVRAAKIQPN